MTEKTLEASWIGPGYFRSVISFLDFDPHAAVIFKKFISLNQACQTGGPRAACGHIACLWRPEEMFLDLHNALFITKLVFFDLIRSKITGKIC